jgi:hypothetical protein
MSRVEEFSPRWRVGIFGNLSGRKFMKYGFCRRSVYLTAGGILAVFMGSAAAQADDYPTWARADYVIGCMAANGNTHQALMQCSCSIDVIASLMPYERYEKADTALSMQVGGGVGGRVGLFRDPPGIKDVIEQLRRAQAEANLQCFR